MKDEPATLAAAPKTLSTALPRRVELTAVIVLLAIYWLMAFGWLRISTITADEGFHLLSGYAYWSEGDFRYQSENGNLPQRLGAVPLLFFSEKPLIPDTPARENGNHFDLAAQFLWQSGNDPQAMILSGRLMMLSTVGLGLCLAVYFYARRLWGAKGGLISLFLAVFSTDLLAHGGLITSDTTFALLMLLSLACVWKMLHRVSLPIVLGTGLVLGLTAVAKFSAPLIGVMALIMWVVCLIKNPAVSAGLLKAREISGRVKKFAAQFAGFAVAAVVAWVVLWAFYDFRFSGVPEGYPTAYSQRDSDLFLRCLSLQNPEAVRNLTSQEDVDAAIENIGGLVPGTLRKLIEWQKDSPIKLLPEAYVHGFLHTYAFSLQRSAFLLGERSNVGWRKYFVVTFLLKTPLPVFGLMALALVAAAAAIARQKQGERLPWAENWIYRLCPLWTGILVYGAMAVLTNLNIGHRHILPIYPLLYILLGCVVVYWIQPALWKKLLLGALLLWCALAALMVRPHFLAYFNPLMGGPSQGYKLLIDSSLDWGQDVPLMVETVKNLKTTGDKSPVYYAHFGSGWPEFYEGFKFHYLPAYRVTNAATYISVPPLKPGLYLIHATQLQSVYVTAPEYKDWEKQNIPLMFSQMAGVFSQWQKHVNSTQDLINILGTQNIQGLQFPEGTPQDQQNMALLNSNLQLLIQYGNLRFIKLCEYLKKREPDFQIGYSINAYRLTEQDLRKAGTFPDVGFDEKYTDELAKKLGILTPDKRYTK